MFTNDYIAQLLNLEDVIITNVENISDELHIYLELPRESHICPHCGKETERVHDYRMQVIKDIPLARDTFLHLRKRRYRCDCGKRFFEKNTFLPRYYRVTSRLVSEIIHAFKKVVSAKEIGCRYNVSGVTAMRYFTLFNRKLTKLPEVISLDEFKGNSGGQKYNSIVVDPDNPNENLGIIIKDILDRLDQIESEGGGSGSDIDIGSIDTDNPPSFYTKAISYEVKKASSIGLTESVGFDKNTSHAVVITYNNAKVLEDVVGSTLKTFQIAFGNSLVQFYREKNSDTDTWSNWTNNKSEGIEPNRSVSWIFSDSMPEPDEQIENDYWIAPVDI